MTCEGVLEHGARIGDFRVEQVLRTVSGGVVYEATQLCLGRRVALSVLHAPSSDQEGFLNRFEAESRLLASIEHPHLPPVLAAGFGGGRAYVATRLVRGCALAAGGPEDREHIVAMLRQVASALDAVHGAGLPHRALEPSCMVVSGERAFLTDFRLGFSGGSAVDDRATFAALLTALVGEQPALDPVIHPAAALVAETVARSQPSAGSTRSTARRDRFRRAVPRRRLSQAALAALAAGVAVGVSGRPEQSSRRASPPSIPAGGRVLGSDLTAGPFRAVDCEGVPPSSNSPSCTVMQSLLPGRTTRAGADGVVVGWAVRGARGTLALQILRNGPGGYTDIARTPPATVPDGGLHRFPAALPIRRGDRVAVELRPGAGIGVREGTPGAATERWIARLVGGPRPPSRVRGAPLDRELLVSAVYVPGRDLRTPAQLTGRRAAAAPAGRTLATGAQELTGGTVRELRVVRLEGRIVLDLFAQARRVARLQVPDARPDGHLLALVKEDREALNDTEHILRWENPGAAEPLVHTYRIEATRIEPID